MYRIAGFSLGGAGLVGVSADAIVSGLGQSKTAFSDRGSNDDDD